MKRFLILSLLLTGCLKTRSEIAETTDRPRGQQATPAQQQRAEQESKLGDLEATTRQMYGRIEAIEHRLNMDFESRQKEGLNKDLTQKQMIEQMKIFEQSLGRIEQRLTEIETKKSSSGVAAGGAINTAKAREREPSTWDEAEQLFNQKDWKKAILSYQQYRDKNPKGKRLAEATYKMGVSFQELGKKDEAKAFFDEVIEKFPKSSVARKAQYRLKSIK